MLIKEAVSKTTDLETLISLLSHPGVDTGKKNQIEKEIRTIRAGEKAEKEAAYVIEFEFGRSEDWLTLHDLRLEHEGRVAQIDHLIINRLLHIWVCESKRFSEGIAVNEHGECTAFFNNRPYGIASPFEQNRMHCAVLKSMFADKTVQVPTRLGIPITPTLLSLVVVSKNARITRPRAKIPELDQIIKIDQIKSAIERTYDAKTINPLFVGRIVGKDTLRRFAEELAARHKPISFDWHARFGLSGDAGHAKVGSPRTQDTAAISGEAETTAPAKPEPEFRCADCDSPVEPKVVKFCLSNHERFDGRILCRPCQADRPAGKHEKRTEEQPGTPTDRQSASKGAVTPASGCAVIPETVSLACSDCGTAVGQKVADYCLTHDKRFGGRIFCRDCQPKQPKGLVAGEERSKSVAEPENHSNREAGGGTVGQDPAAEDEAGATPALACVECGSAVDSKVASFCRVNSKRFKGRLLCRACQIKH